MKPARTIEELKNVKLKDMTDAEYSKLKSHAMGRDFSPAALFHHSLKGYDFFDERDNKVCKWDLWAMGYRLTDRLINNQTKFKAIKNEEWHSKFNSKN